MRTRHRLTFFVTIILLRNVRCGVLLDENDRPNRIQRPPKRGRVAFKQKTSNAHRIMQPIVIYSHSWCKYGVSCTSIGCTPQALQCLCNLKFFIAHAKTREFNVDVPIHGTHRVAL